MYLFITGINIFPINSTCSSANSPSSNLSACSLQFWAIRWFIQTVAIFASFVEIQWLAVKTIQKNTIVKGAL